MNIENKVIIVTGGNGLLGKAICSEIRNYKGICINLDISNSKQSTDHNLHFDLNSDKSIHETINFISKKYKRIDGLVNNAYPRTQDWSYPLDEISNDSISTNIDMQLSRLYAVTKPVIELMKKNKSGSIVNISSIYGMIANDFELYKNSNINPPVAYSAIKGGVIGFTKFLASYLAPHSINCNSVSPGGIFDDQDPKFVEKYNKRVPIGRMANPQDISPVVVFLLSKLSNYITGQNIAVDGGWTVI